MQTGDAKQQPDGMELKATETPDGISVVVPKLSIHTMVVAELADR